MKYLNYAYNKFLILILFVFVSIIIVLTQIEVEDYKEGMLRIESNQVNLNVNENYSGTTVDIIVDDKRLNIDVKFEKTSMKNCYEYCYYSVISNNLIEHINADKSIKNIRVIYGKLSYLEMVINSLF